MKFTCQRSELLEALSLTVKAVPSNPQTPIYSGVNAILEDGILRLRATNNELDIMTTVPATIASKGEAILPAKYFYDFVRTFPGADIEFELDDKRRIMSIRSGNSHCDLLTMSGEYPLFVRNSGPVNIAISAVKLKKLITGGTYGAVPDMDKNAGSKPIFTGCLIDVNPGQISLVSTNTHRLALARDQHDTDAKIQAIVPARTLMEIGRALPDDDTVVTMIISREKVSFEIGDVYISTRLLEGVFPDYNRVIPKNLPTIVTVDRTAFSRALGRAGLVAHGQGVVSPVVKLSFRDNSVTINAHNQNIGSVEEKVEVGISGPDIDIAFNPDYISDCLRVMNGDMIEFRLEAPLKSTILIDPKDPVFSGIVTPVRTKT